MEYLSKSKIKTILQCPYKYRLQYIENKPYPVSTQMARGTQFHERMESINNDSFEPETDIERFVYDIHKDLVSKGWRPIMTEEMLVYDELEIRGIVDKLYEVPPGEYFGVTVPHKTYCVCEFKTGNPRIETLRFELSYYALLINNTTDYHVEYMLAYIPDREEVYFSKIHTSTFKATLRKISEARKIIENGKFEKKVDIHCQWCPYVHECLIDELNGDDNNLCELYGYEL